MPERGLLDIGLVVPNAVRADGQGQAMAELAHALIRRGHRLTVYAHRVEAGLARLASVRHIPEPPGPRPLVDLVFFAWASALVHRAHHDLACVMGPCAWPPRPFVLYAQFSHAGWRSSWAPGRRPPLRHRLHSRLSGALERMVCRRADHVIACAPALGPQLERAARDVTVVPNGVDPSAFAPVTTEERRTARAALGVPEDAFAVAFVGEYHTGRKGLDPLLAAIARGDEHLLVAGDGPAARLARTSAALGLGSRCHLLGFRPARQVIAAADAVAIPSLYEPFSIVALEAAASQVPVAISESAGAAAVLDGIAFGISEPWDAASVRRALDALRSAPVAELAARTAAGRALAEQLAWPACAAEAAAVIERVAGALEVEARR